MSATSSSSSTHQEFTEPFDSNESRWMAKSRVFQESEMQSIHELEIQIFKQARLQFKYLSLVFLSGPVRPFRESCTKSDEICNVNMKISALAIFIASHILNSIHKVLEMNRKRIMEVKHLTTVEGLRIIRGAIVTTRPRPRYPTNLVRAGVLSQEIYDQMIQLGLEYERLNPEYKQSFDLRESENQKINEFLLKWNPFIIELDKNIPDPELKSRASAQARSFPIKL